MEILNQIKVTFKKAANGINKEQLVANISMEYGVTSKKAREYLGVLMAAGFIEEDAYGLWLGKKFIETPSNAIHEAEDLMSGAMENGSKNNTGEEKAD